MASFNRPHTINKATSAVPAKAGATPAKDVLSKPHLENPIPSSSPAFATPVHPVNPRRTAPVPPPNFKSPTVLPILLPPAILRPLAFRTFTKKYNLTVSTSALTALATFIGRHCGSGWKDDGLAEGVLEEAAKMWKKQSNAPIVDGEGDVLKSILKTIESSMSGGRIVTGKGLTRQGSFAFGESHPQDGIFSRPGLDTRESFGVSKLDIANEDEEEDILKDPREWIKVIGAFEQPRMVYSTSKKHFDRSKSKPSLFPPPSHKTELFHQRFNIVHQRILRNESFQKNPMAGSSRAGHPSDGSANNKITPISNLLGRTNSSHLLFGLLTVLPTGTLALADLTGSIPLDIQHARPFPDPSSVWFCPGMLFLIDGMYIEDGTGASESNLGTTGGIGGTIGGRFLASVIAHPPCERRSETLGIQDALDTTPTGPAFGWTDFLGVGSERATGSRMRKLESRILGPGAPHQANTKIAIAAEVNLDNPSTLTAIRSLFSSYAARPAAETPLAIVLMGNFISHAALTGAPGAGSIEYKEYFNGLAAVLSDFPTVLANTTLVFVPGDQDAWPSSFSAGAAVPIPRKAVPEMFTSRVRRVVAEANREVRGRGKGGKEGEVVWASNPARMSWFGCAGEMVMFRDDISGRLRRTAVRFAKSAAEDEDAEGAAERGAAASIEVEDQDMDGDDADTQPMDVDGPARDLDDDDVDPDILAARRLTKTLLDQAHLSPFPISTRPVHWDYASALQLYPLPSALVIADPEAPLFALNYMGCCVMNPGRLIDGRKGARARWIEFDVMAKKGEVVVEGA